MEEKQGMAQGIHGFLLKDFSRLRKAHQRKKATRRRVALDSPERN
jgi:hypothetical protein